MLQSVAEVVSEWSSTAARQDVIIGNFRAIGGRKWAAESSDGSAAGWLTGGISSTPGCAVHRGTPRSPRRPTDRRLAIDRPSRDTSQSVSHQTDRRRHSAVPPRRMSSAPARWEPINVWVMKTMRRAAAAAAASVERRPSLDRATTFSPVARQRQLVSSQKPPPPQGLNWGIPSDLRSGTSYSTPTTSNNTSCTSQLRSDTLLLGSTTLLGRIQASNTL